MTPRIDDFAKEIQQELENFVTTIKTEHKKSPKMWPVIMETVDWYEAFIMQLEQG